MDRDGERPRPAGAQHTHHRVRAGRLTSRTIQIRGDLNQTYADVLTRDAVGALEALATFDADRRAVMAARITRRAARARDRQRIAFLDPSATIARTTLTVQQARD